MTAPELQAANAILKRGVRYKIPAPLFFRLFGKKEMSITITQLSLGTELRMAAILAEKGITEDSTETTAAAQFMIDHYTDILKLTAISTLNRYSVSKPAMWIRMRILRRLSVWQLFELYTTVRKFSGVGPFMTITRLAVEMRMTKPNLGQMTGS